MIVINQFITKSELLKEMANQLSAPDISLHLDVEILPNFLNTAVAFTIFNYQISNFPKPVFWLSYNREIVHFLHNCQASFPPNFLAAQQPLLTAQKPEFSKEYLSLLSLEFENTNLESVENNTLITGLGNYLGTQSENLAENQTDFESDLENNFEMQNNEMERLEAENLERERIKNAIPKVKIVESLENNSEQISDFTNRQSSFIDFGKIKNPKKSNINLQREFQQEFATQKQQVRKKIDFNFPISEQLKNISDYESLSSKNLFRQNRYNRSSLIGDIKTEKPKKLTNWFQFPKNIWSRMKFKENLQNQPVNLNLSKVFNSQESFRNGFQNKNPKNSQIFQNDFQDGLSPVFSQNSQNSVKTSNLNYNLSQNNSNQNKTSNQNFEIKNRQRFSENTENKPQTIQKLPTIPKIDKAKIPKIRFHKDVFADFNKNYFSQISSQIFGGSWLKKNVLAASAGSFSVAIIIFLFFVSFFPTQAYTLEISPVGGFGEADFELNLQQFETKNLILENQVQTIPSGKENLQLPKATGKVQLINRGNNSVLLTNGGFLLVSKERIYFQLPSGNSNTITIPANNVAKPLEVQIEAENKGENYNLPINETLSITNLKGEGVCDNCFGKTVEEIKNSKPNPANIISENDKKNLLEKSNAEINEKIEIEVQNMIKNGNLSNQSWLKTLDKNQTFVGEVGKAASELKLTTKINLNLFGLKNSQIFRLLKEKNDKIFQANNFQIVSSSGWDAESKTVKVKIGYNYSQYENLSTSEILEELSQNPVNEVQKKFQAKYSGLRNIKKEEKGLKVPGVAPRVNIDIIKNEKVDVNN